MGLKLALCFVLAALMVCSLAFSCLSFAQANSSVPTPSVPEFSLKLVDHSYDVPSSNYTTTDPYTGNQTVTTYPGYYVRNMTIDVIIKNQPFTSYQADGWHTVDLSYNVSYKGHFDGDWNWIYYPSGSYSRNSNVAISIPQSTSDTTVVEFKAPDGGQMDFRVQAQIGYYNGTEIYVNVPGAPFSQYTLIGEVSGWSDPQTVTVPASPASPSPSLNPTSSFTFTQSTSASPSQSTPSSTVKPMDWVELVGFTGLGLVVALLVVVVALLTRKIKVLERRLPS